MMKFLIRIRSSLVIWTGGGVILQNRDLLHILFQPGILKCRNSFQIQTSKWAHFSPIMVFSDLLYLSGKIPGEYSNQSISQIINSKINSTLYSTGTMQYITVHCTVMYCIVPVQWPTNKLTPPFPLIPTPALP